MEASPLTLAHDHARAASNAQQTSETTVAINEHTLAAGEFARAKAGTGSEEALRTLNLLEQHHRRLAELIKTPPDRDLRSSEDGDVLGELEKPARPSPAVNEVHSPKDSGPRKSNSRRSNPAASGIVVPRRMPHRDMSSSIASNLASARGIRSTHDRRALSPSVTAHQAPGNMEVPSRRTMSNGIPEPLVGIPSWLPPTAPTKHDEQAPARVGPKPSAPAEEGFQRFYNTFESFLSKISAPLAFASLPLLFDESVAPEPKEAPKLKHNNSGTSTSVEPDLTKLISRAALRASANHTPGMDSFYVVPTAGHTVSYANILSFAEKEKRRLAASTHSNDGGIFDEDNEDFVDARETLTPTSSQKKPSKKTRGSADLENVIEELGTENKSLKECIDQLTKRLHTFEMAAQSSGMRMQESMRLMRPQSPAPQAQYQYSKESVEPVQPTDHAKAMEEQLELTRKDMEILIKENEKLKTVVYRYRERWEKLKEGAKSRREGSSKDQGGQGGQGAQGIDSPARYLAG